MITEVWNVLRIYFRNNESYTGSTKLFLIVFSIYQRNEHNTYYI